VKCYYLPVATLFQFSPAMIVMVCTACGSGRSVAPNQASVSMIRRQLQTLSRLSPTVKVIGGAKYLDMRTAVGVLEQIKLIETMLGADGSYSVPAGRGLLEGQGRRTIEIALGRKIRPDQRFSISHLGSGLVPLSQVSIVAKNTN